MAAVGGDLRWLVVRRGTSLGRGCVAADSIGAGRRKSSAECARFTPPGSPETSSGAPKTVSAARKVFRRLRKAFGCSENRSGCFGSRSGCSENRSGRSENRSGCSENRSGCSGSLSGSSGRRFRRSGSLLEAPEDVSEAPEAFWKLRKGFWERLDTPGVAPGGDVPGPRGLRHGIVATWERLYPRQRRLLHTLCATLGGNLARRSSLPDRHSVSCRVPPPGAGEGWALGRGGERPRSGRRVADFAWAGASRPRSISVHAKKRRTRFVQSGCVKVRLVVPVACARPFSTHWSTAWGSRRLTIRSWSPAKRPLVTVAESP